MPSIATGDYVFDAYDPTNVIAQVIVESFSDLAYDSKSEAIRPYGRPDPVVVTDVRGWATGTLVLITETEAELTWMRNLLATGRIIGFRAHTAATGITGDIYLHVGKVQEQRIVRRAAAPQRRWSLDVTQVQPPVLS